MKSDDLENIKKFYDSRAEQYGNDIRSVGWGSQKDQFLRFEVLLREVPPTGKTILDIGCGKGDLIQFLDERYGKDYKYIGVDLSSSLISCAEKAWSDRGNVSFFCGDIFEWAESEKFQPVDISVLSGALTYRLSDNESLANRVMTKMYEVSSETAALNFLTKYVDFELEKNFHFEPEKVFSWAKKLSKFVSLFHDYPLWEFTIQVHKKSK